MYSSTLPRERVELLEIVPAAFGDVELLEGVLRATVVLVDREQALPRVDRLGAVLDLLGVEEAEALQRVRADLRVAWPHRPGGWQMSASLSHSLLRS